jgi:multidrug resistance protein, MATE family
MLRDSPHAGEARALLVLGLPIIGSHLAQIAMHITDTVMLGWYAVDTLAAVVLGVTTFITLFLVGSGFGWAVMPMIAAAVANGQDREVRRLTRMALWLSLAFGIAVMPLLWFSDPLLRALGQAPELTIVTQDYLRIAGWGIFPALVVMVLKSYLAALERTQVVLWITVAGALLNGALNWALIFGNWGAPELGAVGAAIATVLTQAFQAVLTAAYALWLPELRKHALMVRFWRPDFDAMGRVFRLGWPIGLTSLAEAGLFTASAFMMGWVGTRELAAHGIALEIVSVTFMLHLGLANAATVRVGQAFGRGDTGQLRLVARTSIVMSLAFSAIAVAVFRAIPGPLVWLFLSPSDPVAPQIVAIGISLLAVAAVFQLADGAQVLALGLLRGVQDTRTPMIHAAISYWLVGMPAGYLLGFTFGYGAVGIWLGLVVGLVLAGALMMTRFWTGPARDAPQPA